MEHFSVIIPVLNEAENIEPLLARLSTVVNGAGLLPEIIFVDDGSRDGTRENIEAYGGPLKVRLLRRDNEKGLTGAVVAGAGAADNEVVVVMDGDLSHPPEAIPLLLATLAEGGCDMVVGSRYVAGGQTPGWPLSRRLGSQLASFPARLLTGVRDPLAGFFACRRSLLTGIVVDHGGFKVALAAMTSGARQPTVREIPIVFMDRRCGISKMKLSVIARYLRQLAVLGWHRLRRHR